MTTEKQSKARPGSGLSKDNVDAIPAMTAVGLACLQLSEGVGRREKRK